MVAENAFAERSDFDGFHWMDTAEHKNYYTEKQASNEQPVIEYDGEIRVLNKTKVRYRGRVANPTERNEIPSPLENDVAYLDNSQTWHMYQSGSWSNTGSANLPVVAADPTSTPTVTGSNLDNWTFGEPQMWVNAERHGVTEFNQDNGPALRSALVEAELLGLPVAIRPSVVGYRIVGNIEISGGYSGLISFGSGAKLNFVDGGIVFNARASSIRAQWKHALDKINIERTGVAGPALHIIAVQQKNIIRWSFNEVMVTGSTGHGVRVEGAYLCSFKDFFILQCLGNGLHIEAGNQPDSYAGLGVNALTYTGGEIQGCAWGVYSSNTKVVNLDGVTVEGNRLGGVWIDEDNSSVTLKEMYTENNASDHPYAPPWSAGTNYSADVTGQPNDRVVATSTTDGLDYVFERTSTGTSGPTFDAAEEASWVKVSLVNGQEESFCDVRIGSPDPAAIKNRAIKLEGGHYSDGHVGQRRAVWVEDGQNKVKVDGVIFHAYGGPPVALVGGSDTTTTGHISGCTRTDGGGLVDGRMLANSAFPRAFVDRDESDLLDAVAGVEVYEPGLSLESPGDSVFVINEREGRTYRHGRMVSYYVSLSFTVTLGTGTGDLLMDLPNIVPLPGVNFQANDVSHTRFVAPGSSMKMRALIDDGFIRFEWVRDGATFNSVNHSELVDGQLMRLEVVGSYLTPNL